jgi:uncharacterized membrane protein (UPF0127 family)
MKLMAISSILIVILLFAYGCCSKCRNAGNSSQTAVQNRTVGINTDDGQVIVEIETADTPAKRMTGLMYRDSLGNDSGMLFVFNDEDIRRFWMKDTLIPLDIFFMSSDGMIVDIKEDFQPCKSDPCESYQSKDSAKYVLEVNAGFAEKKNIKIGDRVEI